MAETTKTCTLPKTIIITDSRGVHLQERVFEITNNKITVLVYKGAGAIRAVEEAMNSIKTSKPDLVILATGICDVTVLNRQTWTCQPRYSKPEELASYAVGQLNAALQRLRNEGTIQVSVATYTGLDLERYNKVLGKRRHGVSFPGTSIMQNGQTVLDSAIQLINKRIIATNKDTGMPTTWAAGAIHPRYKKQYRNHYNRLTDGCHLNEYARRYWALQMAKTMRHYPYTKTNKTAK